MQTLNAAPLTLSDVQKQLGDHESTIKQVGEKFKAIREAKKAMSITPERGVIVVDYQDSPE